MSPQGTLTGKSVAMCSSDVVAYLDDLLRTKSPGDRIPSERALGYTLGVARTTVRVGTQQLIAAGRLIRRHGYGVYVAESKVAIRIDDTEDRYFAAQGVGYFESHTCPVREKRADEHLSKLISIATGDPIVELERVLCIAGTVMALEDLVAPRCAAPCVTGSEAVSCGCVLCARDFTLGSTSVSTELASGAHARRLRVGIGHPLLVVEQIGTDVGEGVLVHRRTRYRADRFRVIVGQR